MLSVYRNYNRLLCKTLSFVETLISSDEKAIYLNSEFAKKCETGAKGNIVLGISRHNAQSHLMLSVLLYNVQWLAPLANLKQSDFQIAEKCITETELTKYVYLIIIN